MGRALACIRQSTFPNLMDTHPPGLSQIDGNLGAANGMLEALIQSRWMSDGAEIELLPALPAQWADGSLSGVHVRGGAVVDLSWKDGKVTAMKVHTTSDRIFRLILPQGQSISSVRTSDGELVGRGSDGTIDAKSGGAYTVTFR